jgi:hypothetical protein
MFSIELSFRMLHLLEIGLLAILLANESNKLSSNDITTDPCKKSLTFALVIFDGWPGIEQLCVARSLSNHLHDGTSHFGWLVPSIFFPHSPF